MEAGQAALKQLRGDVERWQRIETAARRYLNLSTLFSVEPDSAYVALRDALGAT